MTPTLALDHLLYATPDVDATTAELQARFGVPFRPGGRHPGWGTRNRILPLGGRTYLEVIGPDEAQVRTGERPLMDVDRMEAPRLAWWAVRSSRMPLARGAFEAVGYVPGEVVTGRRTLEDGSELSWQITDPRVRLLDGIVPLVIDWQGETHPGAEDSGVTLRSFRLEHPDHTVLTPRFAEVGLPVVDPGPAPALIAIFDVPGGEVILR